MMQALEQGLGSLRFAFRTWLLRLGWRRDSSAVASQRLARDLGLPADKVHDILDHAFSDLRELPEADADPWPIIERAMQEIEKLGSCSDRTGEAAMARDAHPLPEHDPQILHPFDDGTLDASTLGATTLDVTGGNAMKPTGGGILTRH